MSDPRQHIMPVYRPPEEAFERGEGVRLITEEGKSYLDFVAGIAVSALGHSHPAMVEALQAASSGWQALAHIKHVSRSCSRRAVT